MLVLIPNTIRRHTTWVTVASCLVPGSCSGILSGSWVVQWHLVWFQGRAVASCLVHYLDGYILEWPFQAIIKQIIRYILLFLSKFPFGLA